MTGKDIDDTRQLPFLLALLRAPRTENPALLQLLRGGQNLEPLFSMPAAVLGELGLHPRLIAYLREPDWTGVEADLRWLDNPRHHLVGLDDVLYPGLLRQIYDPPPALFVKGGHRLLDSLQLAVVGSRHPSPDGRRTARAFSGKLAAAGITITSGLALGIDSQSHLGALDEKGTTIAVLGCGLRRMYPAANAELAEKVCQHGALVSEFPLDYPPLPANFPRRNRIISGMSIGVLVVEAALKSGSLVTARCAMEQGREVFAIPGSIHNPVARGCHSLIRDGARLVEQLQDITQEFGPLAALVATTETATGVEKPGVKGLDADAKLLLDSIGYQAVDVDYLVEAVKLPANIVSCSLLALELGGLIEALPGGSYVRKS